MADLTLAEFLLARIAEDESSALKLAAADARPAFSLATTVNHPARLLAECESKRQQIAHLVNFMEGDYAPWNETHLRMMAAIYADHPDYREDLPL